MNQEPSASLQPGEKLNKDQARNIILLSLVSGLGLGILVSLIWGHVCQLQQEADGQIQAGL